MTEVKVALRDGGLDVREWVQPCQSDLPQIIEAVEYVKKSVNECLTQLINENRNVKDEIEFDDQEEEEEDEGNSDSISGFIKDVTTSNEQPKGKRKSNNLNRAKRFKK